MPAKPLPIYRQLYFQVIVAIVLGAILGHYEPLVGDMDQLGADLDHHGRRGLALVIRFEAAHVGGQLVVGA
ncbi:hypothetical protein, partial [Stenotrophomonas sp. 3diitr2024]|uniref:hypothetical protein n=1 Tax=Stenotrophomonas sp. 3diitr2024 TaxID=3345115 RepID=UPI0035CA753E